MDTDFELPSAQAWDGVGLRVLHEIVGGYQSRVVLAVLDGEQVVVKLGDRRSVSVTELGERVRVLTEVAALDADVVAPCAMRGETVISLDGWLGVVYPFIDGVQPDVSDPTHVALMGASLARLHRAFAGLATADLPRVAALRAVSSTAAKGDQLLHGDFGPANLRLAPELRILDFDDCGYGPVEFDVANTLYMVMFDSWTGGAPDSFRAFRPQFVEAYAAEAGAALDASVVDSFVALRRAALLHWLDHLDEAPIGIRSSSAEWLDVLRRFVAAA